MSYFEQFMQQWKAYLQQQLAHHDLNYVVSDVDDDLQVNSLFYFRWLRTRSDATRHLDESRDNMAWLMLQKQLTALANKAEKGSLELVSRLYLDESQIQICLRFHYDDEQHIFYVS